MNRNNGNENVMSNYRVINNCQVCHGAVFYDYLKTRLWHKTIYACFQCGRMYYENSGSLKLLLCERER